MKKLFPFMSGIWNGFFEKYPNRVQTLTGEVTGLHSLGFRLGMIF